MVQTNAKVTPLQAVLRYRDLLDSRACSAPPRQLQYPADLPPIRCRHPRACVLLVPGARAQQRTAPPLPGQRPDAEWQPLLRDFDRLQEATIEKDGRIVTTRTHVTSQVGNVFKAAGIALPHNLDEQLA